MRGLLSCRKFRRELFYRVFEFVPFFKVSDVELVFSLPNIFSFLPEIQSDRPFSVLFEDDYGFPPFLTLENGDVFNDFVEFGYRKFFLIAFCHASSNLSD